MVVKVVSVLAMTVDSCSEAVVLHSCTISLGIYFQCDNLLACSDDDRYFASLISIKPKMALA